MRWHEHRLVDKAAKLGLDLRSIGHVVLLGFVRRMPWRVLLAVKDLQECAV